jgi:hypothetical protein
MLNGQQQAPVTPPQPTPAVTAYDSTPYYAPRYEHLLRPTYLDLCFAALSWDIMVAPYHLSYAFVGRFAARLRAGENEDWPVFEIEIAVEHASYANNGEALQTLLQDNPNRVAITDTNRHIVLTAGCLGVAFRCIELGTDGYPQSFVPITARGPECTFYKLPLRIKEYGISRYVPVIHSRLLLLQRLFRFDPTATGNDAEIEDIRIFLQSAVDDNSPPFPDQVSHELFPRVLAWIKYAEDRHMGTSRDDLRKWRFLGLNVPDEYISRACCDEPNSRRRT